MLTSIKAIKNFFESDDYIASITNIEDNDSDIYVESVTDTWQLSARVTADGILIESNDLQTETTRIRVAKTAEEAIEMTKELWGIYLPF